MQQVVAAVCTEAEIELKIPCAESTLTPIIVNVLVNKYVHFLHVRSF